MPKTMEFCIGKITGVRGLRGEVKASLWLDDVSDIEKYPFVYVKSAPLKKKLFIKGVKYHKNSAILSFRDIDTIDEAEKYRGAELFLTRDELGEPPDGRYYISDIIGLMAYTKEGVLVGKVTDVINTGGSDVYVISKEGRRDILIPITPELDYSIDLEKDTFIFEFSEGLKNL